MIETLAHTPNGRDVRVEELEWGTDGYEHKAASLAAYPLDWVVAADCLYIDNVSFASLSASRSVCLSHLRFALIPFPFQCSCLSSDQIRGGTLHQWQ